MPTIGENIVRLRVEAGFETQTAFALALGVPQARLSDWEKNRYVSPELPNLLRIAKVLRVSVDRLIRGFDADYDALVDRIHAPAPDAEPPTVLNHESDVLLQRFRAMTPAGRQTLLQVAKMLPDAGTSPARDRR